MKEFTELKTFKDKILVMVDLLQKSDQMLETDGGLKLWTNQDWGFDGKTTKPVVATVYRDTSKKVGLMAGDVIICHHNTFEKMVSKDYKYGDTGVTIYEEGRTYNIFSINESEIQCRIDEQSGKAYPMPGFMLVERIAIHYPTNYIITPHTDKYIDNQFKVIKPGTGEVKFKAGQVVITYPKSDYTINYNYRGKQFTVVRVKHSDVLATSEVAYQPGEEWTRKTSEKNSIHRTINMI